MNKNSVIIPLALCVLIGCANKEDGSDSKIALMKKTNPPPIELVDNPETDSYGHAIKREISKMEELYDVAVIQGKEETLVVYKVKHLHRFKMKKIEKKMDHYLEDKYPKEDFILSSDYKIFLETIRLKEKLKIGSISKKDAETRFQEIVKLQKEKT
ncbi:sporulation protein [Rossellomorea sp. YZS02]|uniref:sporulation protein n=1 Tax=Rossellomorea sp. YZS02 TaxID=3097358 RepID=UPI002A14337F|nr:sporulation protein [Rossellomorea sp. YZS02]MDX8345718.1 sporulation protein [Rossellomorea sp. YZS02]